MTPGPGCCRVVVTIALWAVVFTATPAGAKDPAGASWVRCHGYDGCILLENGTVRVVLEPNCGGRVIEYTRGGVNALFVDPAQDGWVWTPGGPRIEPCAGRCDIGPEEIVAPHPALWLGSWKAEITGPRAARLTSAADSATGLQLVRDFRLDAKSSRLRFSQTIRNVSGTVKRSFHWGRTFAAGGGIVVVPLTPESRFPAGYVL